MRSLRLLSNRARGRLVFCFCSFVSSSLFFSAGTKNVSPSFFCVKKKQNKNGRDRPWLAPAAAKKEKKRVGGKKTRERKYVCIYDTGGHFLFSDVLEAKLFVFEKKKEKKRRRNVVCEPQTSSSFKKTREKKREPLERRGLISPLIQKRRFKIFRLLARAKTQGHESSNNDIGHVFHENGSIFFVSLLLVEMQNFLLLVDVDVDVFQCA